MSSSQRPPKSTSGSGLTDDPVFRLFGAAGVGKTTTAREVMERHPGGLQCAFSGKAAYNLGVKTGHPAQTLHSRDLPAGEVSRRTAPASLASTAPTGLTWSSSETGAEPSARPGT